MAIRDWLLANGDGLQQSLFLGLLVALAVAEAVLPFRPGPMARRIRWPTNLLFTAANIIVLGALPVSMLAAAEWAEGHQCLGRHPNPAIDRHLKTGHHG